MAHHVFSGSLALFLIAACGSSSDSESSGDGAIKDAYEAQVLTTKDELGNVLFFNGRGKIVTQGKAHGLAIVDLATRVFTPIGHEQTRFLGIDDEGDVLMQEGGPYYIRHGADGHTETLPARMPGHGEITPFMMTTGGGIWAFGYEEHDGELATPGYLYIKNGVVETFHGWGDHPPPSKDAYKPFGGNDLGQVLFCKFQDGTEIAGNGLPETECFVAEKDGSATFLNPLYKDAFRATPVRMNARGEVAGTLNYGESGLGEFRAFLYRAPTAYLVGDGPGTALALSDAGDVIYGRQGHRTNVRVKKANGALHDLDDYLRNPSAPEADVNFETVLAINAQGVILVVTQVPGNPASNVTVLTPKP